MSTTKPEIMHESARRVLASYQSTGEPFALFLSSWSFDDVRKEALAMLDENPGNMQARIGLERQVRILLKQDGLETVSIYRKGDDERIAMPEEWPALSLANDTWLATVTETAAWADLIVMFWGLTTPGLTDELKICSAGSNPLKTVVVVNLTPTEIFMSQLYKWFPRVAPLREIPPLVALHPEFSPLIARMKKIKKRAVNIRSRFIDPKKRLAQFPLPPPSGRFEGGRSTGRRRTSKRSKG